MHLNSALMFERHAAPFLSSTAEVLEVGPDKTPSTLQSLAPHSRWDTVDLAAIADRGDRMAFASSTPASLTFTMTDPLVIPIDDESYDVVVAANVIEHVQRPFEWVAEAARVLRRGGVLALVCPISWPEHRAPYDCWRIYPDGMRSLFDAAGLQTETAVVDRVEPTVTSRWYPATSAFWVFDPTRHEGFQRDVTLKDRVKAVVRWPTPAAVDCVGVGRKP
jgi:SAM-dependent methyltransferase